MSSLHPSGDGGHDVRTADPAELSGHIIDTGVAEEPTNRVSNLLTEVADDVALVESFSHMVVIRTDDGLVSFDASLAAHGEPSWRRCAVGGPTRSTRWCTPMATSTTSAARVR